MRPVTCATSSQRDSDAVPPCSDSTCNWRATVKHARERFARVAILGAATRGEFREEDALCAAWLGGAFIAAGFSPEDASTEAAIERWAGAPTDAFLGSKSVAYLRATNQLEDLSFILEHVDDVGAAFALRRGEVVEV